MHYIILLVKICQRGCGAAVKKNLPTEQCRRPNSHVLLPIEREDVFLDATTEDKS